MKQVTTTDLEFIAIRRTNPRERICITETERDQLVHTIRHLRAHIRSIHRVHKAREKSE